MRDDSKSGTKYGELRTEKQFIRKLIADVVSRFGDSLDAIAYSWMVYMLSGSASLSAATFAVNTLVSVVLSPFSASLITGWNKKAVIVSCDIGRGTLVTLTAALYFAGILQPWMVMLITGLNSTLEAFRLPAGAAIFPQIIAREKYTLGMSLAGALSNAAQLAGLGLAGILLELIGASGVLLIDAGTFLFSAAVLSTLRLPKNIKEAGGKALNEFVRNTKEGFKYAFGNSLVLAICGAACFLNFAVTPLNALQSAYVYESLGLGAKALSAIGFSLTLGMGLSSLLVPKLLVRMSRFALTLTGAFCVSVSFLASAFVPGLPDAWRWVSLVAVFLVMGSGLGFANTVVQISFMENIGQEYLARMTGIMQSLNMAAMPVSALIAAGLAGFISVTGVLMIFGGLAVVATFGALFVKPLRRL